jgi:uncharacterized protein (DUF2249 family)
MDDETSGTTTRAGRNCTDPLSDDHRVLLWQTCAYADDLTDAASAGHRLTPAYDAMLSFLHYGLLPYLASEERQLPPRRLRHAQMRPLLLTDHDRLRADVDNIEASRTRQLLALATGALVDRLDRHVRREERWIRRATASDEAADAANWALPLLLEDDIDLDALPGTHREQLLHERLGWMRPGEVVHIESAQDLHEAWRRHHMCSPRSHLWVYEQDGPEWWRVRVTRRTVEVC